MFKYASFYSNKTNQYLNISKDSSLYQFEAIYVKFNRKVSHIISQTFVWKSKTFIIMKK